MNTLAFVRRGSSRNQSNDGFTLIELLVVIAIIAILASLLLTAMQRGKILADSTACKNNLRQYGIALRLYTDAFEAYPPYALADRVGGASVLWHQRLEAYGGAKWRSWPVPGALQPRGIQVCPSYAKFPGMLSDGFQGSYGYNNGGYHPLPTKERGLGGDNVTNPPPYVDLSHVRPGDIRVIGESEVICPSDMIAMGDADLLDMSPANVTVKAEGLTDLSYVPSAPSTRVQLGLDLALWGSEDSTVKSIACVIRRHGGRWNMVFCDGHVESLTTKGLCDPRQEGIVRRWNRDHVMHPDDAVH